MGCRGKATWSGDGCASSRVKTWVGLDTSYAAVESWCIFGGSLREEVDTVDGGTGVDAMSRSEHLILAHSRSDESTGSGQLTRRHALSFTEVLECRNLAPCWIGQLTLISEEAEVV